MGRIRRQSSLNTKRGRLPTCLGTCFFPGRSGTCPTLLAAIVVFCGIAQAQPVFNIDVRFVRLLVTAKDQRDDQLVRVAGLQRDFSVFDCGVSQTISVFERNTAFPLSVSVMIDTSGSTAKDLHYEVTSVEKFLKTLLGEGNPKDAAALYSFNDSVTLLSSFTRREGRLNASLRDLHADGGTLFLRRSFAGLGRVARP